MPAERIHLLHLCYHSVVKQGILRSQVVEPMRRLAGDPRLAITIVSGERVGERDIHGEARLREELRAEGIAVEFFQKHVGPAARTRRPGPLQRALAPWHLWRDVRRMSRLVESSARAHRSCVVHCRSYIPAWAALRAKSIAPFKMIFDPRGSLPEELRDANGWRDDSRRFRWWKRLERHLLEGADEVIAVSQPMAEHFAAIATVTPLLIRNCVDLGRFRLGTRAPSERDPLRLVFLVGVDVPYQAIEMSVAVREAIARLWPGDAVLRILSPDAEAIRERLGGEWITCDRVPRDEIPKILADSDIGILVRDTSVGSRVACPVKFAEYLAVGLPVIATNGIGECDTILCERRCGVSLDPSDASTWETSLKALVERIASDREGLRTAARRTAEEIFDWEQYMPLLREVCGLKQ